MRHALITACLGAIVCLAGPATASAQGTAVANPHYVSIKMEIDVDRPAKEVWDKVGGYCDIGAWFQMNCEIIAGPEDDFGSVRSVANEVLVGRTEMSYTYTQPVREGTPYNLYHGTLEARPVTATTSKLLYTLVYDNSMLADDATRQMDMERRRTQFTQALQNMKIIAEGGTLPPRAPRGGGRGGRGGRGN